MDERQPEVELAAIRRLMEETRHAVHENGKHFIAWGVLMCVALVATYVLVSRAAYGAVAVVWPVAIAIGWIFSLRAGRVDYLRAPVRTLGDRILSAIWVGFGITATLLGLLGPLAGTVPPEALSGLMAALIGGAFFTSGFLQGLHWLRLVALAWWTGGAAMLWWPGLHTLLVLAGMVLLLQVLPGLALRARSPRPAEGLPG